MNKNINGFELTNPDTHQYIRKVSDTVYDCAEVRLTGYDMPAGEEFDSGFYAIVTDTVDLDAYTDEEKEKVIVDAGGFGWKQVDAQTVARYLFENNDSLLIGALASNERIREEDIEDAMTAALNEWEPDLEAETEEER